MEKLLTGGGTDLPIGQSVPMFRSGAKVRCYEPLMKSVFNKFPLPTYLPTTLVEH